MRMRIPSADLVSKGVDSGCRDKAQQEGPVLKQSGLGSTDFPTGKTVTVGHKCRSAISKGNGWTGQVRRPERHENWFVSGIRYSHLIIEIKKELRGRPESVWLMGGA